MKGKVLVFGSINTDLVIYLETLPAPGETVTGGKFMSFPGGKGANQAVAAARAGAKVEMFGCLGDDLLGRERMVSLENAGVSTENITIKAGIHRKLHWIPASLLAGGKWLAVRRGSGAYLSKAFSCITTAWGLEGQSMPYMI